MKTTLLISALLFLTMAASPVCAQEPGDLGVFFDPAGTITSGPVLPSVPFNLYVVAFDVPVGLLSYEGSFQTTLLPGLYFVLSSVFEPAGATNVGTLENWNVITPGCYLSSGPTLLVTMIVLPFVANADELFGVGPAIPSSFNPPAPGYVNCNSEYFPFSIAQNGQGIYPDGVAVGNPTLLPPIASEKKSWGDVKALFR